MENPRHVYQCRNHSVLSRTVYPRFNHAAFLLCITPEEVCFFKLLRNLSIRTMTEHDWIENDLVGNMQVNICH